MTRMTDVRKHKFGQKKLLVGHHFIEFFLISTRTIVFDFFLNKRQ